MLKPSPVEVFRKNSRGGRLGYIDHHYDLSSKPDLKDRANKQANAGRLRSVIYLAAGAALYFGGASYVAEKAFPTEKPDSLSNVEDELISYPKHDFAEAFFEGLGRVMLLAPLFVEYTTTQAIVRDLEAAGVHTKA